MCRLELVYCIHTRFASVVTVNKYKRHYEMGHQSYDRMGNLCTLLSSRNKVAPQTETIALMNRTIASQNATILSQEEEISNHEKVIASQEATIASQGSEISGYEEAITRQEATIASLESEISVYEEVIVRQEATLSAGDALARKELTLLYIDIQKKISSY